MMAPEDKASALKRERERQRLTNAYHRVFKTKDGELIIADIKTQFATDSQVFLPGYDFNPVVAALRDGQRGVLIHIETMLRRPVIADGDIEGLIITEELIPWIGVYRPIDNPNKDYLIAAYADLQEIWDPD